MRGFTLKLCVLSLAACAADEAADTESGDVGDTPAEWAVNSITEEAGSTHLWIVDRAADVLGSRLDIAAGARARAWLTNTTCKSRWQRGLYDADYRYQYNGGWFDLSPTSSTATIAASGATWASHFYDPDTGLNYKGQRSPTAKSEASAHVTAAKKKLSANNLYDGCYELGLALHFFTDLTQPMHASNYTATDWPTELHTHVEEYAIQLQAGGAPGGFVAPSGTLSSFIDAAGRRSKTQWPGLKSAIAAAYGSRCGSFNSYWVDHTECWQNDAAVNSKIVTSMAGAINDTAAFLVLANLP